MDFKTPFKWNFGVFFKKKQKIKIPSSDWEKKGGKWGIQLPHVVFIENNKNSKIIKYYNQDQTKDFLVNAIYYWNNYLSFPLLGKNIYDWVDMLGVDWKIQKILVFRFRSIMKLMLKFPYNKVIPLVSSDFFYILNKIQPITLEDCLYYRDYTTIFIQKILTYLYLGKVSVHLLRKKNINYISDIVNLKATGRLYWAKNYSISVNPALVFRNLSVNVEKLKQRNYKYRADKELRWVGVSAVTNKKLKKIKNNNFIRKLNHQNKDFQFLNSKLLSKFNFGIKNSKNSEVMIQDTWQYIRRYDEWSDSSSTTLTSITWFERETYIKNLYFYQDIWKQLRAYNSRLKSHDDGQFTINNQPDIFENFNFNYKHLENKKSKYIEFKNENDINFKKNYWNISKNISDYTNFSKTNNISYSKYNWDVSEDEPTEWDSMLYNGLGCDVTTESSDEIDPSIGFGKYGKNYSYKYKKLNIKKNLKNFSNKYSKADIFSDMEYGMRQLKKSRSENFSELMRITKKYDDTFTDSGEMPFNFADTDDESGEDFAEFAKRGQFFNSMLFLKNKISLKRFKYRFTTNIRKNHFSNIYSPNILFSSNFDTNLWGFMNLWNIDNFSTDKQIDEVFGGVNKVRTVFGISPFEKENRETESDYWKYPHDISTVFRNSNSKKVKFWKKKSFENNLFSKSNVVLEDADDWQVYPDKSEGGSSLENIDDVYSYGESDWEYKKNQERFISAAKKISKPVNIFDLKDFKYYGLDGLDTSDEPLQYDTVVYSLPSDPTTFIKKKYLKWVQLNY